MGWALIVLVLATLTDAFDGLLARRAGQLTTLGAWLDPVADKLLIATMFVLLTLPLPQLVQRVPLWLTVLVMSRDIGIVVTVAIVNLAVGRRTFPPSIFGKAATATFMLTAVLTLWANYINQPHAAGRRLRLRVAGADGDLGAALRRLHHRLRRLARRCRLAPQLERPVAAVPRSASADQPGAGAMGMGPGVIGGRQLRTPLLHAVRGGSRLRRQPARPQ